MEIAASAVTSRVIPSGYVACTTTSCRSRAFGGLISGGKISSVAGDDCSVAASLAGSQERAVRATAVEKSFIVCIATSVVGVVSFASEGPSPPRQDRDQKEHEQADRREHAQNDVEGQH